MTKQLLLTFIIALLFSIHSNASELHCEGLKASITLYDLESDKWSYTDKKDAKVGTLPASTFKIFNSLIALDRGATTDSEIYKWDGTKRFLPQWNKDMNLKTAFEVSAVWVHELLASRMSPNDYNRYLKWANYGNRKIHKNKNGNFWVYGDFKITPIEQIEMLTRLYKDELPFSKNTMQTVKSFMPSKDHPNIYAKTGLKPNDNGTDIGWWVGWKILEDKSPLFFATRLRKPSKLENKDFADCRISMTLDYLKKRNF